MTNRKAVLFLVIATVMMLLVPLAVGCGAQKASVSEEKAEDVLDDVTTRMSGIESVKVNGKYELKTLEQGTRLSGFDFTMEIRNANTSKPEGHVKMIEGEGAETEVYIVDGYAYKKQTDSEWVKVPAGEEEDPFAEAAPTEMTRLAESASSLQMVSEDVDTYEISFDVGSRFLEDRIKASLGSADEGSPMEKVVQQIIDNTTMKSVFRVSKKTLLIKSAGLEMDIKGLPEVGDVALIMQMAFAEYNEPVDLELPVEAAAAEQVGEDTPVDSGELPPIPGLND